MGDHLEKPYDFYEEAEPIDTTNLSAKAQIVRKYRVILNFFSFTSVQAKMALDSNEYIRKLQEKYPIGNCEHYPHMRVLTQVVGGRVLYWELTLARIQIWANYLVSYFVICFERDANHPT